MSYSDQTYAKQTIHNKSFIKRFSHRIRFKTSVELCLDNPINHNSYILDYGTGDAFFLTCLDSKNNDISLAGFESDKNQYELARSNIKGSNIILVNDLLELTSCKFDVITYFEVLEHLTDADIEEVLEKMRFLVKKHGKIIISVPLESGFSGIVKNIIRFLLNQSHAHDKTELIKSVLGYKIDRKGIGYYSSHLGFRHKDLEILIKKKFDVVATTYSPFPILAHFINSQVFYVLRPRL